MKKALLKIILKIGCNLLVIVFVGCVAFLVAKDHYDKKDKVVERIREVEVPIEVIVEKEIVISGDTIRSSMVNIGKLCTAEYNFTHVERFDSAREINGFKIPFTTATFIYSYDGTITAGIDFTKIQIDKNDNKKQITVILPEADIISSDVDQDSFKLYDEKNNIFNPITVTDVADSFSDLKTSEEQKAVEEGLLVKAKENAKVLVENFIRGSYNVGDYDIQVRFDMGE